MATYQFNLFAVPEPASAASRRKRLPRSAAKKGKKQEDAASDTEADELESEEDDPPTVPSGNPRGVTVKRPTVKRPVIELTPQTLPAKRARGSIAGPSNRRASSPPTAGPSHRRSRSPSSDSATLKARLHALNVAQLRVSHVRRNVSKLIIHTLCRPCGSSFRRRNANASNARISWYVAAHGHGNLADPVQDKIMTWHRDHPASD